MNPTPSQDHREEPIQDDHLSGLMHSLIAVMKSRKAEPETIAIAAELIAAEARLNSELRKRKADKRLYKDEFFAIVNLLVRLEARCQSACEAFSLDNSGFGGSLASNQRLRQELLQLRGQLE